MVKPPRTMQPESIDLKKAGRAPGKAFQDDSFHNYMARKISLQRQQFGLILPPDPNKNLINNNSNNRYNHNNNKILINKDNVIDDNNIGESSSDIYCENNTVKFPQHHQERTKLLEQKHSSEQQQQQNELQNNISYNCEKRIIKSCIKNNKKNNNKKRQQLKVTFATKLVEPTKDNDIIISKHKINERKKNKKYKHGIHYVIKNLSKIHGKITKYQHEQLSLSYLSSMLLSDNDDDDELLFCNEQNDDNFISTNLFENSHTVKQQQQAVNTIQVETYSVIDNLPNLIEINDIVHKSPKDENFLIDNKQTYINCYNNTLDVKDENNSQSIVPNINTDTNLNFCCKSISPIKPINITRQLRPDLFFIGVVILVNGYTNPDVDTLQRILHKHGGDLERYETSRITHIIAENLSTAKAKMYIKQRNPKPVCYPKWIIDCVKVQKLLPYGDYIINEMKDSNTTPLKSVTSFFTKQTKNIEEQESKCENVDHNIVKQTKSFHNEEKDYFSNKYSEIQDTPDIDMKSNSEYGQSDATCSYNVKYRKKNDHHPIVVSDEDSPDDVNTSWIHSSDDLVQNETNELVNTTESARNPVLVQSQREDYETNKDRECIHKLLEESVNSTSVEIDIPNVSMDRYINGKVRTVGTDPTFLESFFAQSRLSFIGNYKQRKKQSPIKNKSSSNFEQGEYKRFVLHVDMDCFFAAVVLRDYPEYRNQPVAISHQGKRKNKSTHYIENDKSQSIDSGNVPLDSSSECATCNYEARKFGIQKGMFLGRARVLCPNLVVLQYDFEGYEEVAEQVAEILDRHALAFNGYVEQVSCDEAYMEIHVPSNDGRSSEEIIQEVAELIRTEIFVTTQCTATIGIGVNKLLAKLATDHVKPNKSFLATNYQDLLRPLKLRDLNGVGYRLERKLATENLISVQDIWDLGDKGEVELSRILGPGIGKKIFGFCNGCDDRPLQPVERKSIGATCNYGVRFDGPYGVDHMVAGLAKEVEKRMSHVGVKGSVINLTIKYRKEGAPPPPKFLGHGSCHTVSKCQATPNCIFTCSKDIIFEVALRMLNDFQIKKEEIRGMGITVTKLCTTSTAIKEPGNTRNSIREWFAGNAKKAEVCGESALTRTVLNFPPVATPNINQDRFELPNINQDGFELPDINKDGFELISSDKDGSKYQHFNMGDVDDDEIIVVDPVRNLIVSTPARTVSTNQTDYYDIALPDLRQIHMSQVKELPIDMRMQIENKIRLLQSANQSSLNENLNVDKDMRFRQTDVKRMLNLASFKSGKLNLPDFIGEKVSLTQLEKLPLEMQLQVANDDQRQLGEFSGEKKKRKNIWNQTDNHAEKKIIISTDGKVFTNKNPQIRYLDIDESVPYTDQTKVENIHCVIQSSQPNFFRDNIMPFHTFMDENLPYCKNSNSVEYVVRFLTICVEEDRISDVTMLLRSIRNRRDVCWNTMAFEEIFTTVNTFVERKYGYKLDKDWLVT